jgi:hypothetical protein
MFMGTVHEDMKQAQHCITIEIAIRGLFVASQLVASQESLSSKEFSFLGPGLDWVHLVRRTLFDLLYQSPMMVTMSVEQLLK